MLLARGADSAEAEAVRSNGDATLELEAGDELGEHAVPEVGKAMARLAVKPVAMTRF